MDLFQRVGTEGVFMLKDILLRLKASSPIEGSAPTSNFLHPPFPPPLFFWKGEGALKSLAWCLQYRTCPNECVAKCMCCFLLKDCSSWLRLYHSLSPSLFFSLLLSLTHNTVTHSTHKTHLHTHMLHKPHTHRCVISKWCKPSQGSWRDGKLGIAVHGVCRGL